MSSGKLTVVIVFALLAAAAGGLWLRAPQLQEQLLSAQDEVVGQMLTDLRGPQAWREGDDEDAAEIAAQLGGDGPGSNPDDPAARFTLDDVEAALAGRRVMYQWSDDGGNVHFVADLTQVPAAYRERAGRVELGPQRTPTTRDRVGFVAGQRAPAKPRPFAYSPDPTVVVYTTPWCGWCRKTVAWLDGEGIAYENRDIEASSRWRDELIRKTGQTSIPVVEIEGELVRGFNPGRMQTLLADAT